MDPIWVSIIGGIAVATFSFLLHRAHKRVEEAHVGVAEVREKLSGLALEVAKDYPPRRELDRMFHQLSEQLRRIEDKLDGKADKE